MADFCILLHASDPASHWVFFFGGVAVAGLIFLLLECLDGKPSRPETDPRPIRFPYDIRPQIAPDQIEAALERMKASVHQPVRTGPRLARNSSGQFVRTK